MVTYSSDRQNEEKPLHFTVVYLFLFKALLVASFNWHFQNFPTT